MVIHYFEFRKSSSSATVMTTSVITVMSCHYTVNLIFFWLTSVRLIGLLRPLYYTTLDWLAEFYPRQHGKRCALFGGRQLANCQQRACGKCTVWLVSCSVRHIKQPTVYCPNAEGDPAILDTNLICSQRVLSGKPPAFLVR